MVVEDHKLPPELRRLLPITKALGWDWSNHFAPTNEPEAKWCMVRGGHAGRVGMTLIEAQQQVIDLAASKIIQLGDIGWQNMLDAEQLAGQMRNKLVGCIGPKSL